MRKKRLLRLFAIGCMAICTFTFVSCNKDDNDEPGPDPTPLNEFVFKFKSSEIVEFKQVLPAAEAKTIPDKEVSTYFGKRLQLACPEEIQFTGDSITIVKAQGLTEKYKYKWESNAFFYYKAATEQWEYLGKRDDKGRVLLNLGMYVRKDQSEQRTLSIIEQDYSLTSYSGLSNGSDVSTSLIWLNVLFTLER